MSLHDTELLPPRKPIQPFIVHSFGLTDPGRVRPSNEDQFVIVEMARNLIVHGTSIPQAQSQYSSHRGHIFIVADGMGGEEAGEVASALTVVSIEEFLLNTFKRFCRLKSSDEHEVMKEFQSALAHADAKVFEEVSQHPELRGMGTTLTMAFAVDWKLFVAHAGDSRCYLFAKNELRQVTQDHTLVAELVRQGTLTPQQAATNRYRNIITNAIGGTDPGVQAELHKLDLEPDDILLLCSDGLTEMVSDNRIEEILRAEQLPQRICEQLVAEANEKGGRDNITVVVGVFKAS